jgi:hypothetical protein
MLLRAEDKGTFKSRIERSGPEVLASYSVDGKVNGEAMTQSDKRTFASEQEARNWLVGEADQRGFPDVESEIGTAL